MSDLTHDQVVAACENFGIDLGCGHCASIFFTGATAEMGVHDIGCKTVVIGDMKKDVLCNLCGLSCKLDEGDIQELGGLIKKTVVGGYASTPGNGCGALDDTMSYTFSLCEFCLDWLFAQFTIPVTVGDDEYWSGMAVRAPWKPAAKRVAADEWRRMKKIFTDESDRRAQARARKAGTKELLP